MTSERGSFIFCCAPRIFLILSEDLRDHTLPRRNYASYRGRSFARNKVSDIQTPLIFLLRRFYARHHNGLAKRPCLAKRTSSSGRVGLAKRTSSSGSGGRSKRPCLAKQTSSCGRVYDASKIGILMEALVACHALASEACYNCKFRKSLRWNGGANASWQDMICTNCGKISIPTYRSGIVAVLKFYLFASSQVPHMKLKQRKTGGSGEKFEA